MPINKLLCGITVIAMMLNPLNLINYESGEYKDMSQNPIIVDLDMCGDVDDVVAVRTATTLDAMHVCTLEAVGLSITSPTGNHEEVTAMHGLLEYDGYSNVPIGIDSVNYNKEEYSSYWDVLIPFSTTPANSKDAVELYKEILKKCYNKVTIITTGYTTNIQKLLEDKEGYELVKNNCERLVITGGSFEDGWDNNFGFYSGAAKAIYYVNNNCPCPILYVPNDVANEFTAGGAIQKANPNDPVAKALAAWGTSDGRASWDPYTVLIGCLPEDSLDLEFIDIEAYFDESSGKHAFVVAQEESNTRACRRKGNITVKQYQDIIEGILVYKYRGGV